MHSMWDSLRPSMKSLSRSLLVRLLIRFRLPFIFDYRCLVVVSVVVCCCCCCCCCCLFRLLSMQPCGSSYHRFVKSRFVYAVRFLPKFLQHLCLSLCPYLSLCYLFLSHCPCTHTHRRPRGGAKRSDEERTVHAAARVLSASLSDKMAALFADRTRRCRHTQPHVQSAGRKAAATLPCRQ